MFGGGSFKWDSDVDLFKGFRVWGLVLLINGAVTEYR